jgi:signal peptidase I
VTEPVFPPAPPPPPKRRRFSPVLLLMIVVTVLGFGAAAYGAGRMVNDYRAFTIPGEAMSPTLNPGDRIVARALDGDEVRRGDVVLFDSGAFAQADQPGSSVFRWSGSPGTRSLVAPTGR